MVGERECLGVRDLERRSWIRDFQCRMGDKSLRGVYPRDGYGICHVEDGAAEGACAATDIGPIGAIKCVQPFQEFRRDQPAPPAHVVVIALARAPCIVLCRIIHGNPPQHTEDLYTQRLCHWHPVCSTNLFLNLFHGGRLASMPPKLINHAGGLLVLRSLAYSAERGAVEEGEA